MTHHIWFCNSPINVRDYYFLIFTPKINSKLSFLKHSGRNFQWKFSFILSIFQFHFNQHFCVGRLSISNYFMILCFICNLYWWRLFFNIKLSYIVSTEKRKPRFLRFGFYNIVYKLSPWLNTKSIFTGYYCSSQLPSINAVINSNH